MLFSEKQLREKLVSRGKQYIRLLEKPICQDYPLGRALREERNDIKAELTIEKTNVSTRKTILAAFLGWIYRYQRKRDTDNLTLRSKGVSWSTR